MEENNLFEKGKIIIYADKREIGTKVYDILKKRCNVREKQLTVADYLLSKNVACERKKSSDFLMSLIDGRLFEQIQRLKEAYQGAFLILEGNVWDEDINVHPNAVRGAIAAIAIDFSLPIIWTNNQLETADMLFTIAKREQEDKKSRIGIRSKRKFLSKNQQQEYIVSGLPKISNVLAKRLLKHFKTPEKVFAASEQELQQVEGIGEVMAKNIRKILTRKYEKSILEE